MNKTRNARIILDKQEINWLAEQRITRWTDQKEVLIYPMGAERYLSLVLSGKKPGRYDIRKDIAGKHILVIPGYGNSAFLFAGAGAKSITVYDKDPVTIAWVKAFKKYYHYRKTPDSPSIGELLTALTCWYPPLLTLPSGTFKHTLCWALNPKSLRRSYIFYMLSLVREAIANKVQDDFELDQNIRFYAGEISHLSKNKDAPEFDTVFVPYLLGVKNGIEREHEIVDFIRQLIKRVPNGKILVNPSRNTKEFHCAGQRYFATTSSATIQAIPGLEKYFIGADHTWFKTQGLAVFGLMPEHSAHPAAHP